MKSTPRATKTRMRRIALTGGIACGKSVAARVLRAEGIPVCDADDLAHAAIEPGTPAHRAIIRTFGKAVLQVDGRIDRPKLGRIVFSDARRRARLNAIVHPAVLRARDQWLRGQEMTGARIVVVIIPLLFETGMDRGWDDIVCVTSPRAAVLRRLRERGLTLREAASRIRAQWPLREKARRSTIRWRNCGSLRSFERQVRQGARAWTANG